MSIEQDLNRIATALEKLASAKTDQFVENVEAAPAPEPPEAPAPEPPAAPDPEPPETQPKTEAPATAPAPPTAPATGPGQAAPAPEPAPEALSADDLNNKLIGKYNELTGKGDEPDTVMAKIKRIIGANSILEVDQSEFPRIATEVDSL